MKVRILKIVLVLVLATLPMAANAGWSEAQQVTDQTLPAPSQVEEMPAPDVDFNSSPVMFVENAGQWDDDARFQVWGGPVGTMWLAEDAIWITVLEPEETSRQVDKGLDPALRGPTEDREDPDSRRGVNIKLSFVGADPQPRIETYDRLDTTVSYFLGDDPGQWRPEVPVWGGVRYVDLYPGVDLEIASQAGQMVPRLAAQPGANLDAVRLHIEGANAITVDGDVLRLSTAAGEVILSLLSVDGLQVVGSQVEPSGVQAFDVAAPFVPANSNRQSKNEKRNLLADNPADLLYGTFLGGSSYDNGDAIAVDGASRVYITGSTSSGNFPTTPGAFDPSYNGSTGDIFVVKPNQAGSGLEYATFVGGSNSDIGESIAVDETGSAYVMGTTLSNDLPTTLGTFDPSHNGGYDAFVVKLNPAGSGLEYATFLGGGAWDWGYAISVDGAGSAYVTGETDSTSFPTTPGTFDPSHNGSFDTFVVKVNPAGSGLAYATFLGGSSYDFGYGITVDGAGSAYVTGRTWSSNFPTTSGTFDPTYNDFYDAFAIKLNPTGSGLAYATFLGGSDSDEGDAIVVDGAGSAYVTGGTRSSDFPSTPNASDPSYNGGHDVFVVKLNPIGSGLAYATFLGGSSFDDGVGIAIDGAGSAYATGDTHSGDFPTTPDAFDRSYNGGDSYDGDGFVARLNPAGSGLAYGTFLGGSGGDGSFTIVVDGTGNTYVTGKTNSGNFPTTPDAFDRNYNGSNDAFVAKLAMGIAGNPTPTPTPTMTPFPYSISGRVTTVNGTGIAGVTIRDNAGHTVVTNANGNFTLSGLSQGTYIITPSKSGYTFSPASRTVSVPPSASSIDFQGSTSSYSISGRVSKVDGTTGVAGVTIRDNAGHTAVTNANGNYTLNSLSAGTYTVRADSKYPYTFGPMSRSVTIPPSGTGINFMGYDQPPIVFVHGINLFNGSCDWADPDTYFHQLDDELEEAGYYVAYARLESSSCHTPPLEGNVWRLDNAIQLAKVTTNRSQVILITHSMGGLVARAYVEGDTYDDDVAQLFTFGSPHQGVPEDLLAFFANGLSLATFCSQFQPAVCDFSFLGMQIFNRNHPIRETDVKYYVVSGDAPFLPRTAFGMLADALLPGSDDGAVQTWSGLGLSGDLDRWPTDETHGSGSGPRNYFIRDGGLSTSYLQCLKRVLVDRPPPGSPPYTCGTVGPSEEVLPKNPTSPRHSTFLYGTLLPGQTNNRSITVEGGETLFAAQWQPGTVLMILTNPSGQTIDPAYAAAHPGIVTYRESVGYATYSFPNVAPGTWQVRLQAISVPAAGASYTAFAAFDSALALSAGTDRPWYTPGATAIISATLSPVPQSAAVSATILLSDSASTTVTLTSLGGGRYQGSYRVPATPGYAEVRLRATGVNANGVSFERGTSLAFQISPNTVALNGSYSDTPEPRWPGASIYQALNVSVGVNVNTSGSYGLAAELVDAAGNIVVHTNVISDLTSGARTLTLRFDGADIYSSQRDGPYTLTNLLLTDHNGATLVVQEAQNVYTTAAYRYRDFRTGDLFLPLIMR